MEKKYKTEWKAGASRVKHVLSVLREKFPDLTIEPTSYALSEEYIPYDEKHEKHEPDILVKYEDSIICAIEVTGSNINMKPSMNIFILKGKYDAAQKRKMEKNVITWFYTVYLNSEYVLDLDLIKKFEDRVQIKNFKGAPEKYIEIPCIEAYPNERLFEWIEDEKNLRRRQKNPFTLSSKKAPS